MSTSAVAGIAVSDEKDECSPSTNDGHNDTIRAQPGPRDALIDAETKLQANDASAQPVPDQHSQLPLSKARTIALVVTLTGAAFLNTLSVQASVIVLPTIGEELRIPAARQQWIVSSYALAFGCFLLLWGRLADVYGKRPIFIFGSLWVCLMTLICPFVPSEIGFNVFRGLQGLGAAANVPTAIGILGVTFKNNSQAKNYAFAAYSSGAPLGSIFGSILGGVVGQYASWKWIFWILAIFAFFISLAGHYLIPLPVIHPTKAELKNAIDWAGGAMVTIALFVLLFALTEGNIVGWRRPYIPIVITLSVVLLVAFVAWQLYLEKRTARRPLVKMTMFSNVRVSAAVVTMAIFVSSFFNYLIFATLFYQDWQGLNKIQTTLRFLPTGPAGLIASFVTAKILSHVKVNYIVMFGIICCATSSFLFAIPISPYTTYWAYGFPAMVLSVFGADTLFPSLILFNSHSLPREDQALGGALINAVGQVGRAIGLAIGIAIQVAVQKSHQMSTEDVVTGTGNLHNPAFLRGLKAGMWFNVGLALCAIIIVATAFRGAGVMGAATK